MSIPEAMFNKQDRIHFCRVIANLIATDRKVSVEERKQLENLVWDSGLNPNDDDVKQAIEAELSMPTPLDKLLAPVKDAGMRRTLYRALVEVAVSDGLAPKEEEKLAQTAKVFQLDEKAAKDMIVWTVNSIDMEKKEAEILKRL